MRSSYFFIFTLYQCIVMQYTSDTRVSNGYDFHACMKGNGRELDKNKTRGVSY